MTNVELGELFEAEVRSKLSEDFGIILETTDKFSFADLIYGEDTAVEVKFRRQRFGYYPTQFVPVRKLNALAYHRFLNPDFDALFLYGFDNGLYGFRLSWVNPLSLYIPPHKEGETLNYELPNKYFKQLTYDDVADFLLSRGRY